MDLDEFAAAIASTYFYITSDLEIHELTNFKNADTLVDSLPEDWKFDLVIGNPPWMTFGLRNAEALELIRSIRGEITE